jgi:hypothetical protein
MRASKHSRALSGTVEVIVTSRRPELCALAVTLLCACARPGPASEPPAPAPASETPAAPAAFVEVEPEQTEQPLPKPAAVDGLRVDLGDGLVVALSTTPVALGDGRWGVEIVLVFDNESSATVFDLGAEPHFVPWISVTRPDGSGYGSAGGCAHVVHMHGGRTHPFAPGDRYEVARVWDEGVGAGEVLELGVYLCDVDLPDGRSIGGEIAVYELELDRHGEPTRARLQRVVALPGR